MIRIRPWLFLRPLPSEAALLGDWVHADSTSLGAPRRLAEGPAGGSREQTLWPAAANISVKHSE